MLTRAQSYIVNTLSSPMKIQYASDLHLELTHNAKYINTLPIEAVGDVLVLAGDIFNLCDKTPPCPKFWEWASKSYREVLIVAGNHEYYHNYDIEADGESWTREILPNVHYHQNRVVRVENTDFILSTLWSDIEPQDEEYIREQMPDFRQIMCNGKRITPADYNATHRRCLEFIRRSVAESDAEHIVVVTHHLPTMAVVAPQHLESRLNSAFATELREFIAESRIDAWIFGHSHSNAEAVIGGTLITSNQLGYVYYREHLNGFDKEKVIDF